MQSTVQAVENKVEDEAVEEHVRQQEEDLPLPALGRFETREHWHEWQPRCNQPSLCSAAMGELGHERQGDCSSKEAAPPAVAMQSNGINERQAKRIREHELQLQEEERKQAALQQALEAIQVEDEAAEAQLRTCAVLTGELWHERQDDCSSKEATDLANVEQPSPAPLLNMSSCPQRPRDMPKILNRYESVASDCIRVVWKVSEQKLLSRNKALNSPDFELWEGGIFKLILRSFPYDVKGGFRGSKGVGRVELKFCGGTELAGKVHCRVAAGENKELPFQGLDHDFAERPQSTLQQEWDFLSVVKQKSFILHLEARMEKEPA